MQPRMQQSRFFAVNYQRLIPTSKKQVFCLIWINRNGQWAQLDAQVRKIDGRNSTSLWMGG
jgi:hypothetical protein